MSHKKEKTQANRCFKQRLYTGRMKLLKDILLAINNLIKVTSSNYLIKHLSLEVINWFGSDLIRKIAQSAGTVKYTDCISAAG